MIYSYSTLAGARKKRREIGGCIIRIRCRPYDIFVVVPSFLQTQIMSVDEDGKCDGSISLVDLTTSAVDAELATLRAQNAHWENVARATNAKLGVALEAVMAVVSATRQYLPPDGISQHECISLVLEATDNPRINQLILAEETRNALAQVAK